MFAGLDLFRLYAESGPALHGVLIVVAVLAWADGRRILGEAKSEANDAQEKAAQAKDRAATAVEETNRHEILLDQIATDVEELADAMSRNDQRINRLKERQASKWGADFSRGGAAAQDVDPNAESGEATVDADPEQVQNQTASAPREDST